LMRIFDEIQWQKMPRISVKVIVSDYLELLSEQAAPGYARVSGATQKLSLSKKEWPPNSQPSFFFWLLGVFFQGQKLAEQKVRGFQDRV
jgi:hypothetical protein